MFLRRSGINFGINKYMKEEIIKEISILLDKWVEAGDIIDRKICSRYKSYDDESEIEYWKIHIEGKNLTKQ
jgi:pectin methylesterase-like acyl-CoA thioesterase